MKASEYVKKLQELIAEHGDIEVVKFCADCYYSTIHVGGPRFTDDESDDYCYPTEEDTEGVQLKEAIIL